MKTCIADIEADNFLYGVSKVFCIAVKDATTGKNTLFEPGDIQQALDYMQSFDRVVFHNGCGYDLPALEKLYGWKFEGDVVDTLTLSRLNWPFLKSHSLKYWGELLTKYKIISIGKTEYDNFDYYEPEMGQYCVQDVEVTHEVYKFLTEENRFNRGKVIDPSEDYVKLEQDIVEIQTRAEQYGVSFDYESAMKLSQQIGNEMDSIYQEVSEKLGYHWETKEHKLKKDGSLSHHAVNLLAKLNREFPEFEHSVDYWVKGFSNIKVPTKITLDTKKLLINKLLELGWNPSMHTEKGSPQIAVKGEVCSNLPEEFKDVGKYFVLKHRKALIDGFFKNVRSDGKIPSEANTLGANTYRYTHKKIVNLPAVRSLYGAEIRGLFGAEKGRRQVGSDLSGIESRILASFMGDAEYTAQVLDGDIHTYNQKMAGLETRDQAKTMAYALAYGAGDSKMGEIIGGTSEEGKKLKEKYFSALPNFGELMKNIKKEAEQGSVKSLDGRPIYLKKEERYGKAVYPTHKALNFLIQSSATVYFKRWMKFANEKVRKEGLDAEQMIAMHDELQWDCAVEDVDRLVDILEEAVIEADKFYELKCPNACDTKQGNDWRDCH